MIDVVLGFIPFVLLIGIVVTVHELGHFLTAKHFGVFCGEFSIGMGPLLYKKQVGETQYSLRLLPVGGFVSMAGEADDTKVDASIPFERTINGIKPARRIMVMMAGIVMNVLLALVLYIGVNLAIGEKIDTSKPADAIVANIVVDGAADQAGMKIGDEFVSMKLAGGSTKAINDTEDINIVNDQLITFEVLREGKIQEIEMTPIFDEGSEKYLMGVSFSYPTIPMGPLESIQKGFQDMGRASMLLMDALGRIFSGQDLDQLSGPVGIYQVAADAIDYGVLYFCQLLALFSINLAVMNALPLPVLDGGRALIVLLETIFKRKFNEKIMTGLLYGGVILLIALMAYATFNDILKMF
ncbi:MAG: RIP metalloprotease RseP [Breznakia sp.]